jgi:uncharacterized repeat protein (TIGR01451 family)
VAEISMASSVAPSAGLVGDQVTFTYTVTNPGTVALTDLEVGSALPDGVDYVSATSQGAVDGATGHILWPLQNGLAPGASTQLSVSATIADPGEWTNKACSVGQDAIGNEVRDCASTTVIGSVVTPTPTATATATPTLTPTVTPTPGPAQPIATPPPAPAQPIATPPPAPEQPIAPEPPAPEQPTAPEPPAQPASEPAPAPPAPATSDQGP